MLTKLIVLLIRVRLGVKRGEHFKFVNQKKKDIYWFTKTKLLKKTPEGWILPSKVSFNWLLDKECRVRFVNGDE